MRRAFTLIELLVVISIISLLIAILLPVMGSAMDQAKATNCQSNMRQLTLGYAAYATDNHDKLMWGQPENRDDAWVRRGAGTAPIKDGAMFDYVMDTVDLYKCPGGRSPYDRTYSIVAPLRGESFSSQETSVWNYAGGTSNQWGTDRIDGVVNPSTQMVFAEEYDHRGWLSGSSIQFVDERKKYHWIDYPGLFHNNRSSDHFSFLDGHVELRRWQDERTLQIGINEINIAVSAALTNQPNNADWDWLRPRYRNMKAEGLALYYPASP